jgi:phosphoesterase RecJ-like protein
MMTSLLDSIQKDQFYWICTHINPDLDAVSSLLSLLYVLNNLGYQVAGKLENEPEWMNFLFFWDLYKDLEKQNNRDEYHVIALDSGSKDRIWPGELTRNAKSIINIDHHYDNPLYGTINICETEASSTAELLFQLFTNDNITLDRETASNLYAGILFDTGGFRYSNTKMGTLKTSLSLIQSGIHPSLISDHVFNRWDTKGFSALQLALSSVEYWENSKILFSFVSHKEMTDYHLSNSDFEGVIDILRLQRFACFSILVREIEPGLFKGSVRAKEPYVIGDSIRVLGGGGHKRAAGFSVKLESIEDIKTILKNNMKALL